MSAVEATEALGSLLRPDHGQTTAELAQASGLSYQACHLALYALQRDSAARRDHDGRWYPPRRLQAGKAAWQASVKAIAEEQAIADAKAAAANPNRVPPRPTTADLIRPLLKPDVGQSVAEFARATGRGQEDCRLSMLAIQRHGGAVMGPDKLWRARAPKAPAARKAPGATVEALRVALRSDRGQTADRLAELTKKPSGEVIMALWAMANSGEARRGKHGDWIAGKGGAS